MKKILLIATFLAIPFLGKAQFEPYCGPLLFSTVEPITLVNFAGINKISSETVGGTPAHEDFRTNPGTVGRGGTYKITLKGNTNGGFTNRFVVFIDWNQNKNFADAGETIVITQPIIGSSGTDAIQAVQDIVIPVTAALGNTRMRVKKTFVGPFLDPCLSGSSFGQAEEYSLKIVENAFAPYCGPLNFTTVEPITLVNFADINKSSSPTLNGTPAHEDFRTTKGNVARGRTYSMTLKGNTNGGFTNGFVVFIDWNQNGNFDDAGEAIAITQPIIGSTGIDAIQAVQDIVVPATAVLGNTRMRVKKTYVSPNLYPCISGSSFGQAEEYTLNIVDNPFEPYCGPLFFTYVEPITLVNFAGINKTSSATVGGTPAHEDFTSTIGTAARGGTYPITLKGNTDGNFNNRFMVFIDWNQNGNFDDEGEAITITQLIVNSTGIDAIQAVQDIVVPATAMLGTTRMRVKKTFTNAIFSNPCMSESSFGQAEEYTLNITALAVDNITKNSVKVYPNPVIDYLNIESAEKVKSITVFDVAGRLVSTQILNAVKSRADLSKLNPGIYLVKIEMDTEIRTVKVIKK